MFALAPEKETVFMTECDTEREERCFEKRARFLQCLKSYSEFTRSFFVECLADTKCLYRLSVRYNILNDACLRQIYPKEIKDQVMCEMLIAKCKLIRKMKDAILSWNKERFSELTEMYMDFLRSTKSLKRTSQTAFMVGGPHEKPLQFYIDGALDTIIYFNALQNRVEARFLAIALSDTDSMNRFERTLCFSREFGDILDSLLFYSRLLISDSCK